ncbi:interleukin-6 receptor subunit beta [Lepisosteus oculatus]|uniref:interleukin-6 receptor subunit beta n=1 Tax=Lepisosteus oculatus TaxID=7918 RepID=UPI00371A2A66
MEFSQIMVLLLFLAPAAPPAASQHDFCCGKIVPESPVIELNTNFTATCVLSESGMLKTQATADDVFWRFKNYNIPRDHYTKINNSAVSITVNVTRELEKPLTCNVLSHGQIEQVVYGIFFETGYPPEKPQNLTCQVLQSGGSLSPLMQCSWDPGNRDPILVTSYTLVAKKFSSKYSSQSTQNHGELDFKVMPVFTYVSIWVEVENRLGKVESDKLRQDPLDIVKPQPLQNIKITSEEAFPNTLLVEWSQPFPPEYMKMMYNVRYCPIGSDIWSEVPLDDTNSNMESFRLQALKPFTEYAVQVRCRKEDGRGYWSDWSPNVTAMTAEAAPSVKPDLWRVVLPGDETNQRDVLLMWKEPPDINGKIIGYEVKLIRGRDVESRSFQINGTNKMISLQKDQDWTVEVSVVNSEGKSPKASLVIPRSNQHELPGVEDVGCSSQHGRLQVTWKPPPRVTLGRVAEYVIEVECMSTKTVSWQRENSFTNQAFVTGDLQPLKRYHISVFPMYGNIAGTARSVEAYLKQGPPSVGPSVFAKKRGKNEVELQWERIPLESQNGFITNYTIFYKSEGRFEKSIVVSPETHMYTIRSLASNSMYVVHVMVSTEAGSRNGTDFTFTTMKYAPGDIEAVVVPICIGFLFLTVLIVLLCINKKETIKKHIWPQVPDPSNSTIGNWSPDSPTQHNPPKEQMCPEGSLIDVSVVEIDAYDKKSMGEEDKTSLSLRKGKYLSEEHSSGIGGSSCMSSPRQSVSDSDEGDSGQTISSAVQYSTVVASGYKGQVPAAPVFARSESTQPLLDSEERPDDQHFYGNLREGEGERLPTTASQAEGYPTRPYFKRARTVNDTRPVKLNQIEIAGNSPGPLGFCPAEEGNRLEQPGEDSSPLPKDRSCDAVKGFTTKVENSVPKSYMPQQNGYRPQ